MTVRFVVDVSRFVVTGAEVTVEKERLDVDGPVVFRIDAKLFVFDRETRRPTKVQAPATHVSAEELEAFAGPHEELVRLRVKTILLQLLDHEIDELLVVEGLSWLDPHVWRPTVLVEDQDPTLPKAWTPYFGPKEKR